MNEQEYRAYPALNYSTLSLFNKSQDHLLLGMHDRPAFRFGHAFETYLQAQATGDNKLFDDKYVVTQLDGEIPGEILLHEGDLSELYVYNKDGKTLNGSKKRYHAWIDFMIENPDREPIGYYVMEDIKHMVDNALKCEFMGTPMSYWLQDAEFQVPITWTEDGVEKKMLADAIAKVGGGTYVIDFKTTANFGQFVNFFKSSYFIQNVHYIEGAKTKYGKVYKNMIFLVSSKEQPLLSQCFTVDEDSIEPAKEAYQNLVADYDQWDFDGRNTKGWKEESEIKLYF